MTASSLSVADPDDRDRAGIVGPAARSLPGPDTLTTEEIGSPRDRAVTIHASAGAWRYHQARSPDARTCMRVVLGPMEA
jgi:hypothetical protein